jgi:hypothetical protein
MSASGKLYRTAAGGLTRKFMGEAMVDAVPVIGELP